MNSEKHDHQIFESHERQSHLFHMKNKCSASVSHIEHRWSLRLDALVSRRGTVRAIRSSVSLYGRHMPPLEHRVVQLTRQEDMGMTTYEMLSHARSQLFVSSTQDILVSFERLQLPQAHSGHRVCVCVSECVLNIT